MKYMFPAVLMGAICVLFGTEAHINIDVIACQTNDVDPESEFELNGDEMFYMDFKNQKVVITLPESFAKWSAPGYDQQAQAQHQICLNNLDVCKKTNVDPEAIDPPQSTIYSRDEVVLGERNTLVCFVNSFYPAPVKVKWTKNNVEVKEGTTLSRYYPNTDFTFRQFSTLSIVPEEGDIYSCTVEHKGLPEPLTRVWEPEEEIQSNMGATAFCGIGLTLGLLGVGVGTFFLIKGNNCN